jgi:hypothetical protein
MSIIDRIGRWVTRSIVAPDPHPEPSRLDRLDGVDTDPAQIAQAVRQMQIDEAVRANRAMCEATDTDDTVTYLCTLHPNHTGTRHQCQDATGRTQHEWLVNGADEAFDTLPDGVVSTAREAAAAAADTFKIYAARPRPVTAEQEVEADMLAIIELGAVANSIPHMNEEDWEMALDELLPADVEGDER